MNISTNTLKAIQEHALLCYPNECCGLIIDGAYCPQENTAADPTTEFRIATDKFAAAIILGRVDAVIHSHCFDIEKPSKHDPRWPSTKDMEGWISSTMVWGIVATNGTECSSILWMDDNDIPPLIGREFQHGIADCYAIIRDYYRLEKNIVLMNGPRAMDWWDDGKDLYADNFEEAGFYEISADEADVGDVCLFRVRSPVINHAAVITGNNQILHHLFHRLSGHDHLDKWRKSIVKYIRYGDRLNTLEQRNLDDSQSNLTRRTG